MRIPLKDIRRLQTLVSRAHCALTPLAADGMGRDGHGGKLQDPKQVLSSAIQEIRRAAAFAERMELSINEN